MMKPIQIEWQGRSGKKYMFDAFPLGTKFRHFPGNYIFARHTATNAYPVYIGQSEDIGTRLEKHEKQTCVERHGATHIHVKRTPGGEAMRLAEETDLRANYSTPCNDQ